MSKKNRKDTNHSVDETGPAQNRQWHLKTSAICLGVFLLGIVFSYLVVRLENPESILRLHNYPGAWQGNHSLKSWAHWQFGHYFNLPPEMISQVQALLILIYLFFLGCFLGLFKNARASRRLETALIGMAFPLMSLIQGTSHDYRLPIYLIPLILSLGAQSETRGMFVFWRSSLILISAIVAMLFGPVSRPVSNTELILTLFGLFAAQAAAAIFQLQRDKELAITFADSPTTHHP